MGKFLMYGNLHLWDHSAIVGEKLKKTLHPISSGKMVCFITGLRGMAMGQKDLFPLWDGSVELAQTLMMPPGRCLGS